MVQNAYGEDEGTCEIANGSSLKVEKKKKFGVVWMEICAFYFFWFGDIDKLTAGVPNPNYLKQNKTK